MLSSCNSRYPGNRYFLSLPVAASFHRRVYMSTVAPIQASAFELKWLYVYIYFRPPNLTLTPGSYTVSMGYILYWLMDRNYDLTMYDQLYHGMIVRASRETMVVLARCKRIPWEGMYARMTRIRKGLSINPIHLN